MSKKPQTAELKGGTKMKGNLVTLDCQKDLLALGIYFSYTLSFGFLIPRPYGLETKKNCKMSWQIVRQGQNNDLSKYKGA